MTRSVTSRARAALLSASTLALLATACVTPERPAAPGGSPSEAAQPSVATEQNGAVAPPPMASLEVPTGPFTATLPASGTLITEGTPVTIDLSGGNAGEGEAPVVVLGEPTVKGLALFMGDAVRPYAATITEAATLRDALAKDPGLLDNPRWLGRAVEVAEQTRLAAQIIDTGLRGGQWMEDARPLAEEIDRNVVVPMVTSASAFLAAAQSDDAERAVEGLAGMSAAMDNLALAMQGLRDRLLELEGGAPADD